MRLGIKEPRTSPVRMRQRHLVAVNVVFVHLLSKEAHVHMLMSWLCSWIAGQSRNVLRSQLRKPQVRGAYIETWVVMVRGLSAPQFWKALPSALSQQPV